MKRLGSQGGAAWHREGDRASVAKDRRRQEVRFKEAEQRWAEEDGSGGAGVSPDGRKGPDGGGVGCEG